MVNREIFATDLDVHTQAQIEEISNMEVFDGAKMVFLPDCHAGKVIPIGTAIEFDGIPNKLMPCVTGADIGCSVSVHRVVPRNSKSGFEPEKLDRVIRDMRPALIEYAKEKKILMYYMRNITADINANKAVKSIGTFGEGNHFAEIDKDDEGNMYVTIHSGSRSLGGYIYEYWLNRAQEESGAEYRILSWLNNQESIESWLNDVFYAEEFAYWHHGVMVDFICKEMNWKFEYITHYAHNTAFLNGMNKFVINKGSIAWVREDDIIPIPLNMRDGVMLVRPNSDSKWGCFLPHGAGRVASRRDTRNSHTVREFKDSMEGIYSSCIHKGTLDEGPFAYKDSEYIKSSLEENTTIVKHIKPIYVYKEYGRR